MDTRQAPADLRPKKFRDADLRGARFVDTDLRGAVLRGVDVDGMEVDSPWLLEGGATLVVNGVDVAPLVDAELTRRFPGRDTRRASDPEGLRAAWEVLQGTWAADEGLDMSVFTARTPSFEEVLEARAGRVAMVRDVIDGVTAEQLAQPGVNPWSPDHPETVLSCLHTILEEEWEHHRYAVRDLDALAAGADVEKPGAAPSQG